MTPIAGITADIGKLAKQAIFSLHRSDMKAASAKLDRADSLAADLRELIATEPTLRSGSFSAAMEEVSLEYVTRKPLSAAYARCIMASHLMCRPFPQSVT